MARKSKNTVDYFPHDCTHGRKMYIVESQFGNDGYAVWFKLLEQLGLAEDHYLDLRDYSQMMFLSSYCKVDEDTFKSILDLLCKIGAINKFLWEKDIIFSDKFIDSVQEAYKRRNNECITFIDLCKHLGFKCEHNDDSKGLNDSKKPQIKVKESKEEEIKEDNSKEFEPKAPSSKPKKVSSPSDKKLHQDLKKDFLDFYANETGNQFYWTAKEAKNLKELISKLKFSIEEKKEKNSAKKERATDEEVISSFRIILENLPKWIKEKIFTIAGINSQYMNILNQIKNGSQQTDTIEEYFRTNFGI
jgi:hypothetical protein